MYIKINGYLQIIQIGPCYVFKPMDSPLLRNHLGKKKRESQGSEECTCQWCFLRLTKCDLCQASRCLASWDPNDGGGW